MISTRYNETDERPQAYYDFLRDYHEEFKEDWAKLVNDIDEFLELRFNEEFDELRDDIVKAVQRNTLLTNVNELLKEENLRLAAQRDRLQGILERMTDREALTSLGQALKRARSTDPTVTIVD
jgi:hypothetical protein